MPALAQLLRVSALLPMLAVGVVEAAAQTSPGITWEVANRFRLFKNEDQFRAIAAAGLVRTDSSLSPALALERELEKRSEAGMLGFGQSDEIAQTGWASAVDSKTCFLSRNFGHRGCKLANGDDYLNPARFDVLARLSNVPSTPGRTCVWNYGGASTVTADCAQQVRLTGLVFAQPFDLRVTADGNEIARLDGQSARSLVIVGFGDSFASGEGNPDRQAQFWSGASDYGATSRLPDGSRKVRYYPLRIGASPTSLGTAASEAVWLNAQCHRSLYSHQLKAALQLAVDEQHVAVTYLGYACTGAEITTGILDFYAGRRNVDPAVFDAAPQLVKFLRDACGNNGPYRVTRGSSQPWQRIPPCREGDLLKPDAILLSIGGNDAGFSRVIAHESVDTGGNYGPLHDLLYRLWLRTASPLTFEGAEALARQNYAQRFPQLRAALRKLVGPAPIVQIGYPQMTETGPGTFCPQASGGMDLHQIFGFRSITGAQAARFLTTLNGLLGSAIKATHDAKWQFVDGYAETFAGHAICSAGAPEGKWAAMAGEMRFPVWTDAMHDWRYFNPWTWVAYAPRNRWFVTPNDAFLTGNSMDITSPGAPSNPRDPVQPLFAATVSGAFHPNALGQAAIADAVIPALRSALNLPDAH